MIVAIGSGVVVVLGIIIAVVYFIIRGHTGLAKAANLYSQRKYGEAGRVLVKVLEEDPTNIDAKWYMANILEAKKDYAKALKFYYSLADNRAISDKFGTIALYKRIARVNLNMGETEAAEKAVEKMLAYNPNDPAGHVKLGELALSRNDYPKAVGSFRQAVSINPSDPETLRALGMCYYEMKKKEDALKTFTQYTMVTNKTDFEVHFIMAQISTDLGKHQVAIANYKKCYESKKYGAESRIHVADLFKRRSQNPKEVEKAYEEAVEFGIEDPKRRCHAMYELSNFYVMDGKLQKAYELWEKIYVLDQAYKDVPDKLSSVGQIKDSDEIVALMRMPKSEFHDMSKKIVEALKHTINKDISADDGRIRFLTTHRGKGDFYEAIVQVTNSMHPIGELNVRELVSLVKDYRVYKGVFITTSTFTDNAIKSMEMHPVDLIQTEELKKLLKKVQ